MKYSLTENLNTSNEQTFYSLFRAILEPVIENSVQANVILSLKDNSGLLGLLKRLELSDTINLYKVSDKSGYNYLIVDSKDYSIGLVWLGINGMVNYGVTTNPYEISELTEYLRNENKKVFSKYNAFRDLNSNNSLYGSLINNLLNMFGNKALEQNSEYQTQEAEYKKLQTRVTAHEIRNQLSICDLYLNVIKKYCEKNDIKEETIDNAVNCMSKAVKLANNCLIELKSINTGDIKPCNLKDLLNSAVSLSRAYADGKNIAIELDNNSDVDILADENKFSAVIINLIKNATESFETDAKNKFIKIETEKKEGFAKVSISNNGKKIANGSEIFKEGFTTKKEGSGLGLYICKKTMEEQFGKIELKKSDDNLTEFELTASIV
ncbi:HAMP domain-containing histidine kinase [bacterium]|nr:HAMP domain-containing histidine kinase [bacterium]